MLDDKRLPLSWRELRAAQDFLGVSVDELWVAYYGMGGDAPPERLERWLTGESEIPHNEHAHLAAALNDMFFDRGLGHPVRSDADA